MSMISSLIDELRKSADEWNGSNMFELARMCSDAADIIWQLRDDLQRANAESAKLREELADAPKCDACEAMLDCDECLRADGSHKERRRLSAENAKLREQLEYALQTSRARLETIDRLKAENAKLRTALTAVLQCSGITKRDKGCDACPMYDKEKEYVWAGDWCGIKRFIRKLGIEVGL